jgi:hypothetical protein
MDSTNRQEIRRPTACQLKVLAAAPPARGIMRVWYCPYCPQPGWLLRSIRDLHVKHVHGKPRPTGSCEGDYLRKTRQEMK